MARLKVLAFDYAIAGGPGARVVPCALAQQGNFVEARRLNQRLMHLHQTLFCEPNPIPVKWAAKQLGLIASDTLRLPMTPLSSAAIPKVEQALIKAGLR